MFLRAGYETERFCRSCCFYVFAAGYETERLCIRKDFAKRYDKSCNSANRPRDPYLSHSKARALRGRLWRVPHTIAIYLDMQLIM